MMKTGYQDSTWDPSVVPRHSFLSTDGAPSGWAQPNPPSIPGHLAEYTLTSYRCLEMEMVSAEFLARGVNDKMRTKKEDGVKHGVSKMGRVQSTNVNTEYRASYRDS